MRVYLPATLPVLEQWLATGHAVPGLGAGVTPALREWYREGDTDELEYAAQRVAARLALELLADDPGAPRRRVVLAVDVPDADVVVSAAATSLGAAAAGDGDAAFALDEADATELGWYAVQELAHLFD